MPVKLGKDDATKTLAELKIVNGNHFVVEDTNNSKQANIQNSFKKKYELLVKTKIIVYPATKLG